MRVLLSFEGTNLIGLFTERNKKKCRFRVNYVLDSSIYAFVVD